MGNSLRSFAGFAAIIAAVMTLALTGGCQSTGKHGAVEVGQAGEVPSGVVLEGRRVIQMTAKRYAYTPSRIVVNEGDTVRLEITSLDFVHGFALKDFGIDLQLPPGVPQIIEFEANKPGRHKFHCDVYCGIGHPTMKGELIVLERQ